MRSMDLLLLAGVLLALLALLGFSGAVARLRPLAWVLLALAAAVILLAFLF